MMEFSSFFQGGVEWFLNKSPKIFSSTKFSAPSSPQ
jgi:hypothetical protein